MSPTSAVSSSSSPITSARRASRSASGRRSSSRISCRLARIDAIGVRSSWEASATSWRCARTERSSASSVRLKVRASRASSSAPSTCEALVLDPLGMSRDRLGLAREPGDRRQRGAGDHDPQQGGQQDPGRGDRDQQRQLAGQRMVDVGQRQRHRERAAAADSGHQHADVRAGDRHVGDVVALAAARDALDRRGCGDLRALAAGHERPAAGVEQRVDARCGAERRPAEAIEPQATVAGARPLVGGGPWRCALGARSRRLRAVRPVDRRRGQRVQRAVELPAQLRAGARVGQHGNGDHRYRDRDSRRQRDPQAQAHPVASTSASLSA